MQDVAMKYKAVGYLDIGAASAEISEERYESIKSAKATCIFALELEEKFAIVLGNFYEFETELLKLAEASRIWPNRDFGDSMLARLKLDQRLVNFLTACRLYQDQTDHVISSIFGEHSHQLTEVKNFKRTLYNDHWGYRFMEALRNHAQHSGLPVHIISYNLERVPGTEEDYSQFTVVPQSSVNYLAEDKTFKKTVLIELQKRGEKIDLRPGVREYVECFAKLHDYLRGKIAGEYSAQRQVYETAIAEWSEMGGQTVMFPHLMKMNEDGATTDEVALVSEFLGLLDLFRNRNLTHQSLTRSFAANTDQKRV